MHKPAPGSLPAPAGSDIQGRMSRTEAFRTFVAPARDCPQIWRLILGLVLIAAVYVGLIIGLVSLAAWRQAAQGAGDLATGLERADSPGAVLVILASFSGAALGAFLAARLLHRRGAATLFGPRRVLLRDFAVATVSMLGLSAVYLALWALAFDAVPNMAPGTWLAWLPLLLLGLLVQTGTEEIVFRGYLLQQLAARFRSPLIWLVLPPLVFGALHYDPAQTALTNAYAMLAAGLFGLLAADLTWRSGSIGAAWGFHLVNNLMALGVLALDGGLTGLALFVTPYDEAGVTAHPGLLVGDLLGTVLAWAVLRRLLRL